MEATQTYKAAETCRKNIFGMVTRKLLCDNRKTLVISLSVILGFWLCVGMINGLFLGTKGALHLYVAFAPVGCAAYAAMAFNDMKNKEGRLVLLMTPATAASKYLPRFLNVFFMTLILMPVGYLMSELGRMTTFSIMAGEMADFSLPWESVFGEVYYEILLYSTAFVMSMGIFFYGSILWPKNSFIKTSAVLIGFIVMVSVVSALVLGHIFNNGYTIEWLLSTEATVWLISGIFAAVGVLFYWLSYRRLTQSTILYRLKQ